MSDNKIRLTQCSPSGGCGCKIAPKELEKILQGSRSKMIFENLMVGNDSKDDAAVFDIGNNQAIISTTDFFTPIVDDPFDFGAVASTNALSDIFAMGGKPIMAIAILGWPVGTIDTSVATEVIKGARETCEKLGVPLAGGHSIDNSAPFFGLAVTGIIDKSLVKRNNAATPNCRLFLTKPVGIGLVSTAVKFGLAKEEDRLLALKLMTTPNTPGAELSKIDGVKALTDVTGFGLGGHLLEMAEGSNVKAVLDFESIPKIPNIQYYIDNECSPGGTTKNFQSYGHKISKMDNNQFAIICDPQTSGGLLVAVEESGVEEVKALALKLDFPLHEIGYTTEKVDDSEIFLEIK